MRAITKEEALEFAGQIWTQPETPSMTMDERIVQVIANMLYKTNETSTGICVQMQEDT